jgi:hypothetical protein
VQGQADALQQELCQDAAHHETVARGVATALRDMCATARADTDSVARSLHDAVGSPITELCAHLQEAASGTERLRKASADGVARFDTDALDTTARRVRLRDALREVTEEHASMSDGPPLVLLQALHSLRDKLTRSSAIDSQLSAAINRIECLQCEITCGSEGSVRTAADAADAMLSAFWDMQGAGIASLGSCMHGIDCDDNSKAGLPAPLVAALGSLAEYGASSAQEIAVLRKRAATERQTIELFKDQKKAMIEDTEHARSTLADLQLKIEETRAAVEAANLRQRGRHEVTLKKVCGDFESSLREGLRSLGDDLTCGLSSTSQRFGAVKAHLADIEEIIAAAESRADRHSGDSSLLVEARGADQENACNNIDTAVNQVAAIGEQARISGSVGIADIKAATIKTQKAQDGAMHNWRSAKDSLEAYTRRWAETSRQAAQDLAAVTAEQAQGRQNLDILRKELSNDRLAGAEAVNISSYQNQHHADELGKLIKAQYSLGNATAETEGTREQMITVFSQGLASTAAAVVQCASKSESLAQKASAHIDDEKDEDAAMSNILLHSAGEAYTLQENIQVKCQEVVPVVKQFRDTSSLVAADERRHAADSAEAVQNAVELTMQEAEAARGASASLCALQEGRWRELQRAQANYSQAQDAAVAQVESFSESRRGNENNLAKERNRAEAASRAVRSNVDELVEGCSDALKQQLSLWRNHLASCETVSEAFNDTSALNGHFMETPQSEALLRGLSVRADVETLRREFRCERLSASMAATVH